MFDDFILSVLEKIAEVNNISSINKFGRDSVFTVSSDELNDTLDKLNQYGYVKNLKSVIILPQYKNISRLAIVTSKDYRSGKCLLIDEGDFLNGLGSVKDWSYLTQTLNNEIDDAFKLKSDYSNATFILKSFAQDVINIPLKMSKSTSFASTPFPSFKEKSISINKNGSVEYQSTLNNFYDALYDKKRPAIENMAYTKKGELIDNVRFVKLHQIADLNIIHEKNNKESLLLSLCGNNLIYYNYQIDDFNGEKYIEITINSPDIRLDYLYTYLTSNKGLDELDYFSNGECFILENIKYVRIAVPTIDIQKNIVQSVKKAMQYFESVEMLKDELMDNILDYERISSSIKKFQFDCVIKEGVVEKMPGEWRDIYNRLPQPLVISYLSATRGGYEKVEKAGYYLNFFEFIAAFNFIILLSGLSDDIFHKNRYFIWDNDFTHYQKEMTFGSWLYVYNKIADIYQNKDFKSNFDRALFNKLSSKQTLDILFKAKSLRNKFAHNSFSKMQAEEIIEELDEYLFDILKPYTNYKLIYTTDEVKGDVHHVILLNGPCNQLIHSEMKFKQKLENNRLYFYNPKTGDTMVIRDGLMKFKSLDKYKTDWEIFIYSNCDTKNPNDIYAYYKCYQQKVKKNYRENITSFGDDVLFR